MNRMLLLSVLGTAALAACSTNKPMTSAAMQPSTVAEPVRVPAGHNMVMQTVGAGTLLYECKLKANTTDVHEWTFVGPTATLMDRSGKTVGKYYGPPATWESLDGSKVTATQVAVSPAGAGNIPHQLVKANPAMGSGSMTGVTYIQRLATKGGAAPGTPCSGTNAGAKQTVEYQADYLFWKAAAS
ncbi:DUF3455 domain-containing protein [Cupriavidus pampae]|uniref:DUF3455 domain-containing protein n=1 Tax=Cupriavidus pampae TaxID=659251 RepID=A0ABN7Y754_9BURK|nr:DUF3455 domain-containing protein [Cupriavidus pampae]CAG9169213.1 hypothetical protein LMG32289_01603 [Cupriavidus pampae]